MNYRTLGTSWMRTAGLCASALFVFVGCSNGNKGSTTPDGPQPIIPTERTNAAEVARNRAKIEIENRALVHAALDRMTNGQRIWVKEGVESQCGETQGAYALFRENDQLQLEVPVQFVRPHEVSPERFEELAEKARACIEPIRKFWSRYDVRFNLVLKSSPSTAPSPDNFVTLRDGRGRADSGSWYMDAHWGDACSVLLHEVGHLIGLPDEYAEEGTCRTAEYESHEEWPFSVMNQHYYGWDATDFFPRHLTTILAASNDPYPNLSRDFELRVRTAFPFLDREVGGYFPRMVFPSGRILNLDEAEPEETNTCTLKFMLRADRPFPSTGAQAILTLEAKKRRRDGSLPDPGKLIGNFRRTDSSFTGVDWNPFYLLECNQPDENRDNALGFLKPWFDITPKD